MNSLTFVVYGLAAPQGSKKSVGNGRMIESSKAVAPWRQDVKHAALACLPPGWDTSVAMAVSIVFRFKRPAHHIIKSGLSSTAPQHCTSARKGDLDKLCRSTFDSLTGVAFDDDRQVISVNASKRYCTEGEPQGAVITITPIA